MNNVIILPPRVGIEYMRVLLREIAAIPPACDPVVVSPIGEKFAFGTTRGLIRKKNEDRVAVTRIQSANSNSAWMLFTICDGMGGMANGARAAEIAIAAFISSALSSRLGATEENMRQSILSANEAVFNEFYGAGGTTLSAIAWDGIKLVTVNVGDSRIYCLGKDKNFHQMTQDDNIIAHLQAQGITDVNDARRDLLQFVGIGNEIDPHVNTHDSQKINLMVATTDGAHDLPDSVISRIAQNSNLTSDLVNHILQLSLWIGGSDNATSCCFDTCPIGSIPIGIVELWTPANYWRILRSEIVENNQYSTTNPSPVVPPLKYHYLPPDHNQPKDKRKQGGKRRDNESKKSNPKDIAKVQRDKKSNLTMELGSLPFDAENANEPETKGNDSTSGFVQVNIRPVKENESAPMQYDGTPMETKKEDQ